ncbi:hypothetical protein F443_02679 [Phytophthora nicotianae P1569]|uniref:Uncharacterized protein n=1 Tax=Phytophthora nicotianae P1569 TaxID=1317065 RepID=V9FSM2_PHYNI|nr:hypothetical protein F443_02679 [Phytophthora nicotianae P1569]
MSIILRVWFCGFPSRFRWSYVSSLGESPGNRSMTSSSKTEEEFNSA